MELAKKYEAQPAHILLAYLGVITVSCVRLGVYGADIDITIYSEEGHHRPPEVRHARTYSLKSRRHSQGAAQARLGRHRAPRRRRRIWEAEKVRSISYINRQKDILKARFY